MATRSLIGLKNKDNTITTIYNHFDGYPEFVGLQLALNYQDEKTIKKLLGFGARRTLLGVPSKKETLGNEEKATTHASFEALAEYVSHGCEEYVYIYEHVEGLGHAWNAYEVNYGESHDIANNVIDKNLKYLGAVSPAVKYEHPKVA